MWLFFGLFFFFAISSVMSILLIKTVTLTDKTLIINKPFLFLRKPIHLKNIKNITESPYKINPTIKGSTYNIHDGRKILIDFHTRKSISLNSYEISDYVVIKKKLKQLTEMNIWRRR